MGRLSTAILVGAVLCGTAEAGGTDVRLGSATITIPKDCKHRGAVGSDTLVGTITCSDALQIEYDIGDLAGDQCGKIPGQSPSEHREGFVFGRKGSPLEGFAVCIETHVDDDTLFVSFGTANFWTTVRSPRDVTRFLDVALSYREPRMKQR